MAYLASFLLIIAHNDYSPGNWNCFYHLNSSSSSFIDVSKLNLTAEKLQKHFLVFMDKSKWKKNLTFFQGKQPLIKRELKEWKRNKMCQSRTWAKILKNGSSKVCGRQCLKNFKGYDLRKQTISLQSF